MRRKAEGPAVSISVIIARFFAAVPHCATCHSHATHGWTEALVSHPLDDTIFSLFALVIHVPLCCEWFYSHRQWLGQKHL